MAIFIKKIKKLVNIYITINIAMSLTNKKEYKMLLLKYNIWLLWKGELQK